MSPRTRAIERSGLEGLEGLEGHEGHDRGSKIAVRALRDAVQEVP